MDLLLRQGGRSRFGDCLICILGLLSRSAFLLKKRIQSALALVRRQFRFTLGRRHFLWRLFTARTSSTRGFLFSHLKENTSHFSSTTDRKSVTMNISSRNGRNSPKDQKTIRIRSAARKGIFKKINNNGVSLVQKRSNLRINCHSPQLNTFPQP